MENTLGKELQKRTGVQNSIQPVRLFNLFLIFTLAKLQKSEGSLYMYYLQPHIHRYTHTTQRHPWEYRRLSDMPVCCRVGYGDSVPSEPALIHKQSSQDAFKETMLSLLPVIA